jgi:hypothetical protein
VLSVLSAGRFVWTSDDSSGTGAKLHMSVGGASRHHPRLGGNKSEWHGLCSIASFREAQQDSAWRGDLEDAFLMDAVARLFP